MKRCIKLNVKNLVVVFALHGKKKMDVALVLTNSVNTLALILLILKATAAITRTLQTTSKYSYPSNCIRIKFSSKIVENAI